MIQTNATGHAGNKRRSDSAVAQQLTPANTRKRAAKTKRLNLFCSIISKQNEVRKIIQINSPCKYTYFPIPPQFNKHLFEIKPVQNDIFKFHSTIRGSKIACYFTKRTVPPAIFPPTDTPRHHFVTHLPSFIYKNTPSPRHSLNNRCQPSPIPAPSRETTEGQSQFNHLTLIFPTPQTTILHIKEKN